MSISINYQPLANYTANVQNNEIRTFDKTQNKNDVKNPIDRQEEYKQAVISKCENDLEAANLSPDEDFIGLFDKTEKKDEFLCAEHNSIFSGKTIIKEESLGIGQNTMRVLSGQTKEKIVEKYDKNDNLIKKTYYKKDGTIVVTNYDKEGKIAKEAEIKYQQALNNGYSANMTYRTYEKDGSYCEIEYTYCLDETMPDDKIKTETNITQYDKDGKVDILGSLFEIAVASAINTYVDSYTN